MNVLGVFATAAAGISGFYTTSFTGSADAGIAVLAGITSVNVMVVLAGAHVVKALGTLLGPKK